MFASKAEKRRYKIAQENAARAKTRLAELEQHAQAGRAATEVAVIDSNLQTLASGVSDLETLKASTTAALSGETAAEPTEPSKP
jgi:hypothetical protein